MSSQDFKWYALINCESRGPYTLRELQHYAAQYIVLPETQLRPVGQEEWFEARSVEGLFSSGASQPQQKSAPAIKMQQRPTAAREATSYRRPPIKAVVTIGGICLMLCLIWWGNKLWPVVLGKVDGLNLNRDEKLWLAACQAAAMPN